MRFSGSWEINENQNIVLVIMISLVSVSIVIISHIAIDNFTKTIKSEIENEFEIVAVNLMEQTL